MYNTLRSPVVSARRMAKGAAPIPGARLTGKSEVTSITVSITISMISISAFVLLLVLILYCYY